MEFSELPDELKEHTFSFLTDMRDLCVISQVSRELREMMVRDVFWRKLMCVEECGARPQTMSAMVFCKMHHVNHWRWHPSKNQPHATDSMRRILTRPLLKPHRCQPIPQRVCTTDPINAHRKCFEIQVHDDGGCKHFSIGVTGLHDAVLDVNVQYQSCDAILRKDDLRHGSVSLNNVVRGDRLKVCWSDAVDTLRILRNDVLIAELIIDRAKMRDAVYPFVAIMPGVSIALRCPIQTHNVD